MPGMPVFQDSPSQLKGQIFVLDSISQDIVALTVDNSGNLSVVGTVDLATGAEVALAAGTEVTLAAGAEVALAAGTEVALAAGTEVALAAGTDIDNVATVTTLGTITNDVKVVNGATTLTVDLAAGAEVALAAGTEVALAAGTEVALAAGTDIDTVTTLSTITNDVKVVNGATTLTVDLAAGAEVALAAGTEVALAAGTEVALAAGTEVALAAGTDIDTVTTLGTVTNDVKVVNGATALNVGLSAGTNMIGVVQNELVFTNVDAFGDPTPLTSKTVGIAATVPADAQDISQESSYNWFIKNEGTVANQNITLVVEISPDQTNWIEDTGTIISVAFGVGKMITVTNFLQYARYVITGGTASTTVISCFQAQH